MDVSHIASTVKQLPTLPQAVVELIQSLRDDDCDVDCIASHIARDPGISAKVLRLANSSFFGLSRSVASIEQAVTVLGFQSVRNIATTAGVIRCAAALPAHSLNLEEFWRHSIATALCAREIATRTLSPTALAYTCGLLHDFGKLVLASAISETYSAMLASPAYQSSPTSDTEQKILGFDHASVGRQVAHHWLFPEDIQCAVGMHHNLDANLPPQAQIVMAADAIVHEMGIVTAPFDMVPPVATNLWDLLGLDEEARAQITLHVHNEMAGTELLLKP